MTMTDARDGQAEDGAGSLDAFGRRLRSAALDTGRDGGIYLLLGAVFVATWLIVLVDDGRFNVSNILVRCVALGIVACGQTFVIVGGSIDLSVAPLITIAAMLTASASSTSAVSLLRAFAVVALVAVAIGFVNGAVVAWLGINGFIATLGMQLILAGQIASRFAEVAPDSVPAALTTTIGYGELWFVPWALVLLGVVVVVTAAVLRRTRFGAHVYASGGDADIARNAGVRVDRATIGAHITSSLCAATAGVYLAALTSTPNVELGTRFPYDLQSIAVVVLGGAALLGGRGTVGRTIAAVVVFALLDTAFNQLGVDSYLQTVVRGVIIIVAVASYTMRGKVEGA